MRDYRSTVFLPQTDFPMRAELPKREPEILKRWEGEKLYQKLRQKKKGKKKFILHYGPPFANGHIHTGHAFSEGLKDIINRLKSMAGFDAPLVPGWDCHGLPIEWKVEEAYREKKKRKDDVPVTDFRAECREFANKWIDIQRNEFKRLGLLADWENPYVTMNFESEAKIIGEIYKFLKEGMIYQGYRPVLWSVVEKTALAEAEMEYQEHTSPSIYVRFPTKVAVDPDLASASCVIWTTTPWTLPGNRGIAYGNEIPYALLEVINADSDLVVSGEKFVIAQDLVENFTNVIGISSHKILKTFSGAYLQGHICQHPFAQTGYDFDVPLLPGDHVTTETGTGLVHTAPGHGLEDFAVGKEFGLELPQTVAEDGTYYPHVPMFSGLHIFKANPVVLEELTKVGALVFSGKLVHNYPHSWRSKAPLIYRLTTQWFIALDETGLRQKALAAIDQTRWVPESGRNRLYSTVESRPDWCISRQRTWGVPIAIFVHTASGQPLYDPEVQKRVVDAVTLEGADAWFTSSPERFLGDSYNAADYTQVNDIIDVWFESGSTHAFVLEDREELTWPADLYLEGSDQHRGWFQSSLLEACATRGSAPYKAVLTHGFVVDEKGRKMSKSIGNVIAPDQIIDKLGADILRLWIVSCDYSDDQRLGNEILKRQEDIYRRLRNTLRYLLGALKGFTDAEKVTYKDFPELEKWVCARLAELDKELKVSIDAYDLQGFYSSLHNFCSVDLSAFYFDIRKDALYCDDPSDLKRRATRTVMATLFETLCHWLAPVICFTAEEAWTTYQLARNPQATPESIHLQEFVEIPAEWNSPEGLKRVEEMRRLRQVMTGALEIERAQGRIGSSLAAHINIYGVNPFLTVDWPEFTIVSGISWHSAEEVPTTAFTLREIPDVAVVVEEATGTKCARCWKVLEEVKNYSHKEEELEDLCNRCADVVMKE